MKEEENKASAVPSPATSKITSDVPSKVSNLLWLGTALLVLFLAIFFLECRQSYYFTQDDNYCQVLPLILQGCQSFFSGVFPQWNPYQLLGQPMACQGLYGLTYPLTYVSYAFAHFILGKEYATIEILAILHLTIGLLAAYWTARVWGVSAPLAAAIALSYILSGYALIAGRCWINMLNAMAWLPLVFGALAVLKNGPVTWKWAGATGLVIGIFFHSGFVQIWVYALMFFGVVLGVFVLTGEVPWRRSLWVIPAILSGIALAAPLLYVQMKFAADIVRVTSGYSSQGLGFKYLLAILAPHPLVEMRHHLGWGNKYPEYMSHLYYSGTVFFFFVSFGLIRLAVIPKSKKAFTENIWLFCALAALLFSFGDKALMWALLSKLPWFGKFMHPERFLALFNFFIALGGGIVIQGLLGGRRGRRYGEIVIAGLVAAAMLYHVTQARPAFWFFEDRPYPSLTREQQTTFLGGDPLRPQRMATLTPMEDSPLRYPNLPQYTLSLDLNFATVYSILSFDAYDPLSWCHAFCINHLFKNLGEHPRAIDDFHAAAAAESRNRLPLCRAYGIRWLTVFRPLASIYAPYFPREGQVTETPVSYIWTLPGVCPLAFAEADPGTAFPIRFDGRGATVDVRRQGVATSCPRGGPFIINILAWPDFRVYADGTPIAFTPDDWGRMRIDVPPGVSTIEARYSPPWAIGFGLGALLAVLAFITMRNVPAS